MDGAVIAEYCVEKYKWSLVSSCTFFFTFLLHVRITNVMIMLAL